MNSSPAASVTCAAEPSPPGLMIGRGFSKFARGGRCRGGVNAGKRPPRMETRRETMNFDEAEMKDLIAEKAAEGFIRDEEIWSMVKRDIDARVSKLFAERAEAAISEAVDSAIKDGFERTYQPVDAFGNRNGAPTTIRKELERLIGNYWSDRVDRNGVATTSSYGSTSRAEYIMATICAKDFSDQMKAAAVSVTAALKDGFRAQLAAHVDKLLDELFRVKSIQDQGKAEKPW